MGKNKGVEIRIPDPVEAVRQKYDYLLTVIIIVLFVGFITLLLTVFAVVIDAWNTKTLYTQPNKDYADIEKKINILDAKIDSKIGELKNKTNIQRPVP